MWSGCDQGEEVWSGCGQGEEVWPGCGSVKVWKEMRE